MKRSFVPYVVLLGLSATACQSGRAVIIDTDMGGDDFMAILYLLRRPEISVKAITVTGTGLAHCAQGVQNARGLVALAEHAPVPVACGRETPLQGTHVFPAAWRQDADNAYGLSLPTGSDVSPGKSAVEVLTSVLQGSGEKVTVLALGPLTNLAEALQAKPDLVQHIARVQVMGGAVDVAGNVDGNDGITNPYAEWNIYLDPHAASQVLAAAPVTLVPLDATNHVQLNDAFVQRMSGDHGAPEADFVYRYLSTSQQEFIHSGYYYFWDPLAAATLTDDKVVTFQEKKVKVVEQEGDQSGRIMTATDGAAIQVGTDADASRFESLFLDTLNRRGP